MDRNPRISAAVASTVGGKVVLFALIRRNKARMIWNDSNQGIDGECSHDNCDDIHCQYRNIREVTVELTVGVE